MAAKYVIELTDRKQRKFWEELLSQLDFVRVVSTTKKKPLKKTRQEKKFQDGLREAIQEMKDDLSGKKALPDLKEALHALRR